MSSPYRTPDQWALQHKAGIQITASVVGLISISVMLYPTSQQLSAYAALVGFVDLMLYSLISTRWTPTVGAYIDYLDHRAKEEQQLEWLASVDRGFRNIWKIEVKTSIEEALANE